ncbi:MAG TPA: hypothetical protein VMF52_15100 [Steroidobacteraceae bacterium]|nr:hypothetical protein [Steroidobacteraceae bacterium]
MSQRKKLIVPSPIGVLGTGVDFYELEMAALAENRDGAVFMMGDNPALAKMPDRPKLLDFYRLRFGRIARQHHCLSAKLALEAGHDEKIVVACFLHDISNGALVRSDHGYWSAQLIAPYVSEEIAWAVKFHQPLRYFADESVGYKYPEAYKRYFGEDYVPPEYIRQAHDEARAHRWYMTSRIVTIYDTYAFAPGPEIDCAMFEDILGRHFREPAEGLGFDGSPVAHMWRAMIWPNNFL